MKYEILSFFFKYIFSTLIDKNKIFENCINSKKFVFFIICERCCILNYKNIIINLTLFFLDVPKLRQSDINFALTVVLNTLWPPTTKTTAPITAQNLKTTTDMRAGSLTFVARDSKTLTKTSLILYQVAFLGKQFTLE